MRERDGRQGSERKGANNFMRVLHINFLLNALGHGP